MLSSDFGKVLNADGMADNAESCEIDQQLPMMLRACQRKILMEW